MASLLADQFTKPDHISGNRNRSGRNHISVSSTIHGASQAAMAHLRDGFSSDIFRKASRTSPIGNIAISVTTQMAPSS